MLPTKLTSLRLIDRSKVYRLIGAYSVFIVLLGVVIASTSFWLMNSSHAAPTAHNATTTFSGNSKGRAGNPQPMTLKTAMLTADTGNVIISPVGTGYVTHRDHE